MGHKVTIQPHILQFKFDAGTSRGVLREKATWYLCIWEEDQLTGIGEAGPLKGLSVDDQPDFEHRAKALAIKLESETLPTERAAILAFAKVQVDADLPSLLFALETALLDRATGSKRKISENSFVAGKEAIPINGLIWMGKEDFMREQVQTKLAQGFDCIKMKIGAIDFETEFNILKDIRRLHSPQRLVLRVDANGAFAPGEEALHKLERLSELGLHSIEQPIKAGQWEEMRKLCAVTPLPIALDEELIGLYEKTEKAELLDTIQPQFIILKPTLLGGIAATEEWIALAEERNIDWWMTSALESNIGLNAISQLTSEQKVKMPQGLGTGQLYHNNIPSPLAIEKGCIVYQDPSQWDLQLFTKG